MIPDSHLTKPRPYWELNEAESLHRAGRVDEANGTL